VKYGEEELVVISGQGVTLTSGADHIAPQSSFPPGEVRRHSRARTVGLESNSSSGTENGTAGAVLAEFAPFSGARCRFRLSASEVIELSTRHNFVFWLALGTILRGWACSASGNTAEGMPWIEQGIRDLRATGAVLGLPSHLARKAEALHLADRTPEALEAINEAEALAERFEQRYWCAELHRLRAVFLAAIGAEENQIEASFRAAISTAKQQKSVSLEKRTEATYAEYRRQRASGSGGRGFRIPIC
jgi:hypothetical protein